MTEQEMKETFIRADLNKTSDRFTAFRLSKEIVFALKEKQNEK